MKNKFLLFLIAFVPVLFACNNDSTKKNKSVIQSSMASSVSQANNENDLNLASQSGRLKIDTLATATARFIAGMSEPYFADIQSKEFYKEHAKQVNDGWENTKKQFLEPIKKWKAENNISTNNDTSTLYYPFSGPDFLYAYAFYPNCTNYIMVGLERTGKMPNLKGISPELVKVYLQNLRASQRYVNKYGYFVTSQMSMDFSKQELDGNIHLILMFLALTKHEIIDVSKFYVDYNGNPITYTLAKSDSMRIKGIRVQFCDSTRSKLRTVYYFPFDLSNGHINKNAKFLTFLDKFPSKCAYMKSASYIMHNADFSVNREYVLKNCSQILQDDTGIPFRFFAKNNFDVELYGNYTKTIKQFKQNYQADLKKALDNRENANELPFIIGYNVWLNETLLMHAVKKDSSKSASEKTSTKAKTETNNEIVYKVQFAMSSYLLDTKRYKFDNVKYFVEDTTYKYTIGETKTYEEILKFKQLANQKGYKDAFVVAFRGKKKISVEEARKLTK